MLFHGPGNGEAGIGWKAFQAQHRANQALEVGVPTSVVNDYLVIPLGEYGRLNFHGLTRAYAERQVKRRIKAYTAILTLQYGIPFVTRQVAWLRYNQTYRALDEAAMAAGLVRTAGKREAVEYGVARLLMRRAPTRLLSRVVPYVGWGLAAWDIYTIVFRGELWGVQIYEKA